MKEKNKEKNKRAEVKKITIDTQIKFLKVKVDRKSESQINAT